MESERRVYKSYCQTLKCRAVFNALLKGLIVFGTTDPSPTAKIK
jgi:hypothetical protein